MEVGRVKADIQKLNIKDLQVSDYCKTVSDYRSHFDRK